MSERTTWYEVNQARAAEIDAADAARPYRTTVVEVEMPDGVHRYEVLDDETPGDTFLRAAGELMPWADVTEYPVFLEAQIPPPPAYPTPDKP